METVSYIGPLVDIGYNVEQGVYIGTLTTELETRYFTSPDYQTVSNEITRAYDRECERLARAIEKDEVENSQTQSTSKSRSAGGAGSDDRVNKPYNFADFANLMFGSLFTTLDELLGFVPRPKKFAIKFGGVVIFASSKRALKKKLIRARNKRIHRLMQHVKQHQREALNIVTVEKLHEASKRLRAKKQQALATGPKSWERRISGTEGDWRQKTDQIRTRIKLKKSQAKDLWVSR